MLLAQVAQRTTVSKGPRAVGVLRLHPDGKAELIPVSIMVDGKFFDANAYKASPVPMALESGTVYEAERTGDSLGLFTVTRVLQQKSSFIGDGNWRPAGSVEPSKGMKAEVNPREEEDSPPTLRRGGSSPAPPSQEKTETKSGTTTSSTESKPASPSSGDVAFADGQYRVVGTDLLHAFLVTMAAGLGTILFGVPNYAYVATILVGSIPGILIGSHFTHRLPERALRGSIAGVLAVGGGSAIDLGKAISAARVAAAPLTRAA